MYIEAKVQNTKLSFSGHETFYCRNLWLKKGFDFLNKEYKFSDIDAPFKLGVGKNMVNSIRYWLKVFALTVDDVPEKLCFDILTDETGYDPYLEDIGTHWLMHWKLVTTQKASIYNILFNELRRTQIEFTTVSAVNFIKKLIEGRNLKLSENTISSDFGVLIRMYIQENNSNREIEESYTGLLTDLELIQSIGSSNQDKNNKKYTIESNEKQSLPLEILLYSIIEFMETNISISISDLLSSNNSPGVVFALSQKGLIDKITTIESHAFFSKYFVYSDQAGIKEFQVKEPISPEEVLRFYFIQR